MQNNNITFKFNMKQVNIRQKFGKRLKEIRKAAALSQEALGIKSNIHRTYIGSIERGDQNISLDNIHKLSKALKVEIKELFYF